MLFFDDPVFQRITDQTRQCNEFRTCVCGGKGERIRLDVPFCCNIFLRTTSPVICCVPVCCPTTICPCVLRYEIYLEDAQKALYEIRKNVNFAIKANPIASDESKDGETVNISTSKSPQKLT